MLFFKIYPYQSIGLFQPLVGLGCVRAHPPRRAPLVDGGNHRLWHHLLGLDVSGHPLLRPQTEDQGAHYSEGWHSMFDEY